MTTVNQCLRGKNLSPASLTCCWRLSASWAIGPNLSFSLASGQKPTSLPCDRDHFIRKLMVWQLTFKRVSKQEEPETEHTRQLLLFIYIPVAEVTSYHLCCIPFLRSKSLDPAHFQGSGLHRAWMLGAGDHWGSLEVAYPRQHLFCGS